MAPPNEDEEAAGRSWLKKALVGSFVVMGLGIIAAVVVLVLYQTDVLSSGDDANTEGVSGGVYCTNLTLDRTGITSPISSYVIGTGIFNSRNIYEFGMDFTDRYYDVWLPMKIPKRKTDYMSITNMTLRKDLSINKTCQKGTTFGYINNSPRHKLQSGVYVASGCAGEFTVCGKDCIDPSATFCTGDTSICISQEMYAKVCDHVKDKCTVCSLDVCGNIDMGRNGVKHDPNGLANLSSLVFKEKFVWVKLRFTEITDFQFVKALDGSSCTNTGYGVYNDTSSPYYGGIFVDAGCEAQLKVCGKKNDTCWFQTFGFQTFEHGGICYTYVNEKLTWDQAQRTCKRIGGHLAEPKTAEQNRFVRSVFLAGGQKDMWLGGDDLKKEGRWTWSSSGELLSTGDTDWGVNPAGYADAGNSRPNNVNNQDCLHLWHVTGHWDDDRCSEIKFSLCQKADLFSFGKRAGDKALERKWYPWGFSTGAIQYTLTYFDTKYSSLYVHDNGGISFYWNFTCYGCSSPGDFPFWANTTRYQKSNLPPLVAAYWANADIQNVFQPGTSGDVYYRQINNTGDVDLKAAAHQIRRHLPSLNLSDATTMFLATWHNVRPKIYSRLGNNIIEEKRCTFQLALVTMGKDTSFAIMNYQGLEWTTGTFYHGGDPRTGLYNGGPRGGPALAGFDAGDEYNFFRFPASRTNQVLRLNQASNTNTPGRWIFKITKPDVSGGLGAWGGWSNCTGTASVEEGKQERKRKCNNPPKQNSGKSCPHGGSEEKKCQYDKFGSCIPWPFGKCKNGGLCTPKVTIDDYTCECLPCFTGKSCDDDNVKDVNAAVKDDKPDDLTDPLARLGFELDEEDRKRLVKELNDVEKKAGGPPDCGDIQDAIIMIKASEASTDTDNTTEATETNWIPYIAAGLGLLFLVSAIALTAFLVKKRKKRAAEEEEEAAYEEDEMSEGEQGQSGAEAGDGGQSSHMPEGQSEVGVMGAITAGLSSLYGEKKSNPPSAAPSALAVPQANRGKSISQEGKKSNPASPSTSALAVPQANRGKSIGGENEDSSRKKSMANEDRKASLAHSSVDSAPIRKKSVAIENRKKSSVAPPRRF